MFKKYFFCFTIFLFILVLNQSVLADHNCNESCGNPSYCNAPANSCFNGICRNSACLSQTDCVCDPYRIQGRKLIWQNNSWQEIEPAINQTVTINQEGGNYSSTSNSNPFYFQGPPPTPGVPGQYNYTVSVQSLPGSSTSYTVCYNNWQCYTSLTPTPGDSITTDSNRADNENYSGGDHYVSIRWYYTPMTPNCKDITSPGTVLVGDSINISATYENGGGGNYPVTAVGMVVYDNPGGCDFTPFNETRTTGSGTYNFSWTPTSTGTYTAFCRAWNGTNPDNPECRGRCVDGPPRYQCEGTDGSGTGSYTTITVQNPQPWYKLKVASLNKIGDHNISVVQNVNKFTDLDSDDTTERYVIIGTNPGVLISSGSYNPGPSYNPILASTQNWYVGNYTFNTYLFDNFYQYLASRKLINTITSLSQINAPGVYSINTDSLNLTTQPPNYNFVLVVRNQNSNDYGNVNISINNFNSSANSILILAKNITVASGVQNINGIFAATDTFSYNNSDGLKIKGNLISKNAVTLQNRSDNSRPSLFIVFNPKIYLDLLPYLSISKYDWQQTQ